MLLFFKRCLFGAGGMMTVLPAFSQSDSVSIRATIAEVTVGTRAAARTAAKGTTATIDEHMAAMPGLTLVRRGSYAFEPAVNSMTTERLSTTIDGMKIFSACTDRMDPVTSYVESANLQTINVNMGLDGNPQASGSIGGSIDMRLRKSGFEAARARRAALSAGYDANGNATVAAADGSASGTRFYADAGFCRRHADNYRAGGDRKVLYSQFTKINLFANAGWRPAEGQAIEAAFIFDRATDVGYPALNMDVGRAEALIVCDLTEAVRWETRAAVAAGVDDDGRRLPLVAPPTAQSELTAPWADGACARPQPSAGAPPPTARRPPTAMPCGTWAHRAAWAGGP